jgi:anoctamin-10
MGTVQRFITSDAISSSAFSLGPNATEKGGRTLFLSDTGAARAKLKRTRLETQMFAFMVTNQAIDGFFEVGLPYVMRAFAAVRSGKRRPSLSAGSSKKKRVGFEDEKNGAARDEREFLERVRREVSLPDYHLFEDYKEMVSQFGYVALWSTIWPLAPCGFLPLFPECNPIGLTLRFLPVLLVSSDGSAQQRHRVPL